MVVLKQTGKITYGALWNQVWSFSGNITRADVNQMFLQPFFAYQATRTVTATIQSETTANWEVDEGRWTIPINVIFAKLSTFGAFPASYQLGFGGFRCIRTRPYGRSGRHRICSARQCVPPASEGVAAAASLKRDTSGRRRPRNQPPLKVARVVLALRRRHCRARRRDHRPTA